MALRERLIKAKSQAMSGWGRLQEARKEASTDKTELENLQASFNSHDLDYEKKVRRAKKKAEKSDGEVAKWIGKCKISFQKFEDGAY